MKTLNIKIPDELHTKMRLCAISAGKSAKQYVTELIQKDVETKKEQTR